MTSRFPQLDRTAESIVAAVLAAPPTLGSGRLVCVDGPSGSGKTTLAAALNRGFRDALRRLGEPAGSGHVRLLHMDNVYDGWAGLAAGMATMTSSVVEPLRDGRPGRYQRYDWHRMELAEERVVAPSDVLVVEGVGSGGPRRGGYDDVVTCLVWVDTPSDVRLERGVLRDGPGQLDHLLAWRRQEAAMFARERTWERADVVVDGASGRLVSSPGARGARG